MLAPFSDKAEQMMQLHYSWLSEKDRRHYAALESLKLGRGGVDYISHILMIDKKTLWQGRKELLEQQTVEAGRQRRKGGGRKKKDRPIP